MVNITDSTVDAARLPFLVELGIVMERSPVDMFHFADAKR